MKVNSVHIMYSPVYCMVHGEFWLLHRTFKVICWGKTVCWDINRKLYWITVQRLI